MERLTTDKGWKYPMSCEISESVFRRLKHYEDAEELGNLLILPEGALEQVQFLAGVLSAKSAELEKLVSELDVHIHEWLEEQDAT